MVEGQPAAEAGAGQGVQHPADRPLVGEEVVVGDHHSAGFAGGAGGVLEEGDRVAGQIRFLPGPGGGDDLGGEAGDMAVAVPGEQPGDVRCTGPVGQCEEGRGVLDDAGEAGFQVAAAVGRRHRDGEGPGVEAGQEADGEQPAVAVHDQHALAGGPAVLEPAGQPPGALVQRPVGHHFGLCPPLVFGQHDQRFPVGRLGGPGADELGEVVVAVQRLPLTCRGVRARSAPAAVRCRRRARPVRRCAAAGGAGRAAAARSWRGPADG